MNSLFHQVLCSWPPLHPSVPSASWPHRNLATPGGNPYPAKSKERKSERLKDVNKQAQRWTNTPALSSARTCGKQTQGTCAPLWPTLYSSLDIDPNLIPVNWNMRLTALTMISWSSFSAKAKSQQFEGEWNLNFEWDHGEQRKGNVADNANLPHLVCTLQLHSVTLPSNLQLIRPKYARIVSKIHQNNLDIKISLQGGCSLTEVTKC